MKKMAQAQVPMPPKIRVSNLGPGENVQKITGPSNPGQGQGEARSRKSRRRKDREERKEERRKTIRKSQNLTQGVRKKTQHV